jgi:hypothetical protein
MTPLGNPQDDPRSYREVVSLDCDNKETSWTVQVDLDFTSRELDNDLAVTEYRLKGGLPQERVLVNEGSLILDQRGPEDGSRVRVTTTKRLKFAGSFDGPAFASVLCHLGYLGFVEDLLCCAAEDEGDPGIVFPGRPVQAPAAEAPYRGPEGAEDFRGLTGATIQQVAAAAEAWIDRCSEATKESYEKIEAGNYTADALIQDVADMYVRMVGDGVTFAGIGLRNVQRAPAPPRRPRAPGRGRGIGAGGTEGAGTTQSAIGEVVENYTELAKYLIRTWRDYGTGVATKLDQRSYTADSAAADLAAAVWLGIQTSARLAWEAVDSVNILTGGLGRPYMLESEEFSTSLPGAALKLKGNLVSGFRRRLTSSIASVRPDKLQAGETKFRIRVDATGRPAGDYWGKVEASTDDDQKEEVSVRITVP